MPLLRCLATAFLCTYAGAHLAWVATGTVAAAMVGGACGATVGIGALGGAW